MLAIVGIRCASKLFEIWKNEQKYDEEVYNYRRHDLMDDRGLSFIVKLQVAILVKMEVKLAFNNAGWNSSTNAYSFFSCEVYW